MPDHIQELIEVCNGIGTAFEDFKKSYDAELKTEVANREALERKVNGQRISGNPAGASPQPTQFLIDSKTGAQIPLLGREHKLFDAATSERKNLPSMGRFLRGIVLGGKAHDARELEEERKSLAIVPDSSGGYTVDSEVSAMWIDQLRDAMVLQQAGCTTVPMGTRDVSMAKVTSDPTTEWHGENATLTPSDPGFGSVTLSAKTITCTTKVSIELMEDSVNIQQILQQTLVQSVAHAIDKAGLVGVTPNAAAAPTGLFNLAGINKVTSVGAPTSWDFAVDGVYELLVDKVPPNMVGAMIAHPALWKKMTKLKSGESGSNNPLQLPPMIDGLPKLWTPAAPFTGGNTVKAIIGMWADYLMGVRKQITFRILNERLVGDTLSVLVVTYARVDFVATRPTSFVSMEGITV